MRDLKEKLSVTRDWCPTFAPSAYFKAVLLKYLIVLQRLVQVV